MVRYLYFKRLTIFLFILLFRAAISIGLGGEKHVVLQFCHYQAHLAWLQVKKTGLVANLEYFQNYFQTLVIPLFFNLLAIQSMSALNSIKIFPQSLCFKMFCSRDFLFQYEWQRFRHTTGNNVLPPSTFQVGIQYLYINFVHSFVSTLVLQWVSLSHLCVSSFFMDYPQDCCKQNQCMVE